MEGVGARLGRSSSRYGTTTVFSGPVRKWKKDWVPIPPSSSSSSNNSNHHHHHHPSSSSSLANAASINGSTNGTVSHLRLFKWTPVSLPNNKENSNVNTTPNNNTTPTKDSPLENDVSQEPPRRKFKYIPVAALVEQRKGAEEGSDDEGKPVDAEIVSKNGGLDEKPDINDMPMEENEETEEDIQTSPERQDLNKSLDLSLG